MPYEVGIVTGEGRYIPCTPDRDKRTARRTQKYLKTHYPDLEVITHYVSPDGKTRELIE